ncbi:MAG: hypothetical protein WDN28_09880 [Chthoniobacter sp.]
MKASTLKMMEQHMPISFARATGRFGGITAPVGFEDEDESDAQ